MSKKLKEGTEKTFDCYVSEHDLAKPLLLVNLAATVAAECLLHGKARVTGVQSVRILKEPGLTSPVFLTVTVETIAKEDTFFSFVVRQDGEEVASGTIITTDRS